MKIRTLFLLLASTTLVAESAFAQESQSRRERDNRDRIERLEKQVRQMQRTVYPDGQPASTAGYYDEPVATRSSVDILTGRIDSLERQITTLIRNNEEAQYRLGQMETELARLRVSQETAAAAAAAAPPPVEEPEEVDVPERLISTPRFENQAEAAPEVDSIPAAPALAQNDPDYEAAGEDAYTQGFRLWEAGNYDQAITTLRAFEAAFPDHRRASWARNLIGRALLDKGEPRAAANALLANYRKDPEGGRAADSLYFLGQSLMRLGQPGQACKAYDELEDVYAGNMRDYLTERLPAARREANCG
ncbi:tetratricopeptide repeat protein [Sphingomicrobium clamense]|uniref:Tetratricopeptide repeat protein n=1 Tax=Sphingomicrobium clamense TaxID=2851013 RepID=A0ABS6V412_9SPHN|nr:tetratricopeptide repeat protein [Sphingomicrobium sp. B8]MBW0144299.1 tetratricopeptide repeat protein [Sphingomicrobium sp. B8]